MFELSEEQLKLVSGGNCDCFIPPRPSLPQPPPNWDRNEEGHFGPPVGAIAGGFEEACYT